MSTFNVKIKLIILPPLHESKFEHLGFEIQNSYLASDWLLARSAGYKFASNSKQSRFEFQNEREFPSR